VNEHPFAITRITHSCHLVELAGLTLLTDPWFSEKAGYHPGEPIAVTVDRLPKLDGILITHGHYDHCDLDALDALTDRAVPVVTVRSVERSARAHGFSDVRTLTPWDATELGAGTVTAAPGAHSVEEITFVIQGDGHTVYFAGDTMLTPGLRGLPARFPSIDVALVPTNGLRIRPLLNRKVVMDARDAAVLIRLLQPAVAIPQHYAFTSGTVGDRLLTKGDRDPTAFVAAVRRAAPSVAVRVATPGERVDLTEYLPTAA
jgi:L-ascorbate metabolism protein UlaG (beta-lactamase superfamily)